MTPQEKAIELYQKYETLGRDFTRGVSMKEHSKQCALIAVDEMIRITPWSGNIDNEIEDFSKEFYMKVKEEIEKI